MRPTPPPAFRRATCLALLLVAALAPAAASALVFRNVTVLPMDREAALPGQDVVVRDGRIVALRDTGGPIADGDTVIDGTGRYLMPGLIDLHTHPVSPAEYPLYLRHGITTILAAGGEPLEWTAGPAPDAAPLQVLATTDTLHGKAGPGGYVLASPDDAPVVVGHARAAGASMLKSYTSMPAPVLEALAAQARGKGMAVVGHLPAGVPLAQSLPSIDLVAHSEEFAQLLPPDATDAEIDAAISALRRHGTTVSPTLAVVEQIGAQVTMTDTSLRGPEAALLPAPIYQGRHRRNNGYANRSTPAAFAAAVAAQLTRQRDLVARMHRAGVPLVFGTDTPTTCLPGACVHHEFAELRRAGLGNYEALRTATFNAGAFLTEKSPASGSTRLGVVTPGAVANLVLLERNPLQDVGALASVAGVMSQGQWLPVEQLDHLVQAYRQAEAPRHALVDRYEAQIAGDDITALAQALKGMPGDGRATLNAFVVVADAQRLLDAGRGDEARALLTAARPHLAPGMAVHNVVGTFWLRAGDKPGAIAEFRQSLRIAPRNANALAAMRELGAEAATTPEAEVAAVVADQYLTGFRDGSHQAMADLFADSGVHVLHIASDPAPLSVTPLATRLPGWTRQPDPEATLSGLRVLCTSDTLCAASFTLRYRGREFQDQLNLVRMQGRWKLVAKVTYLP
jgi:hypothetical protein